MQKQTLLGICGALRQQSTNRKLLHESFRLFGPADCQEADLRLPLYDGDLEEAAGIPPGVALLARQVAAADAIVIATPEYNKSVPGVLKNALDWISRTRPNPWLDKPVAIVSAAAGRAGGDRSQFALRLCLTPFRPRLITGPEVLIANSAGAFDDHGQLRSERERQALETLMQILRREASRPL